MKVLHYTHSTGNVAKACILEAQESAARAALGDNEFESQRASGARLNPQQAIEEALLSGSLLGSQATLPKA